MSCVARSNGHREDESSKSPDPFLRNAGAPRGTLGAVGPCWQTERLLLPSEASLEIGGGVVQKLRVGKLFMRRCGSASRELGNDAS